VRNEALGYQLSADSHSQNPTAARPAQALDAGHTFRVVVVGQLFAFSDRSCGDDPDRAADDVRIAVRPARVIDVPRDVAAERSITRPPFIDVEDPDPLPRQISLLPAPALGLGYQRALVLDDTGIFVDRLAGIDAPAGNARRSAHETRKVTHADIESCLGKRPVRRHLVDGLRQHLRQLLRQVLHRQSRFLRQLLQQIGAERPL